MDDYINYSTNNNHPVLYSDIVYKKEEYELFSKWFENEIKPFKIFNYDDDSMISVILNQEDYWYDWVKELKIKPNQYGDGHCYNDAFNDYLDLNFKELNKRLEYDSENGMFCVYCESIQDAEEVAYELSTLYKDENKMINLIKEIKEKYNYIFETAISI